MKRSAYAIIKLDNLAHNLNILRSFAPHSKVISVVKANAYGHGITKTAQALTSSDAFAVACTNEAAELRASGILHPIICLQGFTDEDQLQVIADANAQTVIHSEYQIKILQNHNFNQSIQVWLKVDTGMGRLGFRPEDARHAMQQLEDISNISKIRLMTHFANADSLNDEYTKNQLKLFDKISKNFPDKERSAANSAATLAYTHSHYEWVRSGIVLYGISPFQSDKSHPDTSELKPAMSLFAPIIAIKQFKKDDCIGYGSTYKCKQDMRVAVIAIGYADGYPRALTTTTNVSIHGTHAPIVGRISMDMMTVDISHIDAEIGDEVELWGEDILVSEVAASANTLSYELLCGISDRVKCIYQ